MFHEIQPETFVNLALVTRVTVTHDADPRRRKCLVHFAGAAAHTEYVLETEGVETLRRALAVAGRPRGAA